jgi:hypoxanthine phosphoribosyltransferase
MKSSAFELLFSSEIISLRVRDLSQQISTDYANCRPVLLGVLKGAFVFLSDLARNLDVDADIDFVQVSSYGSSQVSSGACTLKKDISIQVADRHVLIVDDIIDTGHTAAYLQQHIRHYKPKSVKLCCLIEKQIARVHALSIDYSAFSIQDGFVVGYGLDFKEQFRGLPALYTLTDS